MTFMIAGEGFLLGVGDSSRGFLLGVGGLRSPRAADGRSARPGLGRLAMTLSSNHIVI